MFYYKYELHVYSIQDGPPYFPFFNKVDTTLQQSGKYGIQYTIKTYIHPIGTLVLLLRQLKYI